MSKNQFSILLLNPPGRVRLGRDGLPTERKHCTPPLGLAYLAATLRQNSIPVNVIDALAEGYETERKIDNFIFYGLSDDQIITRILLLKPAIVGISILFSNLANEALRLARLIKTASSDTKILLGGHHPSAMPFRILHDNQHIDFILSGEADNTLVMLCKVLMSDGGQFEQIRGCYWRSNDGRVHGSDRNIPIEYKGFEFAYVSRKFSPNPSVDSLTFPAWDLFPMEAYWRSSVRLGASDTFRERYGVMVSTRGCPHICDFCTSPLMGGFKNYRKRDNHEVVDEILYLRSKYGIEEIQFLDDNFFVSRLRLKGLLKLISERCNGMLFSVPAGTEANTLDEEIIALLSNAGFYRITLAIESGNKEIQQSRIDKK